MDSVEKVLSREGRSKGFNRPEVRRNSIEVVCSLNEVSVEGRAKRGLREEGYISLLIVFIKEGNMTDYMLSSFTPFTRR